MKIDTAFYPGFTRKSITFTIDDGNVPLDKKFLDIVRPAGMVGTFNLCSHSSKYLSKEQYREMYAGYEIANHCKYHPFAFKDGESYEFSDEAFEEATADETKLYKTEIDDIYYFKAPNGWRKIATQDAYCRFIDECKTELEEIFGENSVTGYAWPFREQECRKAVQHIKEKGYYSIRKTGEVLDKTGFALPVDRMAWSFNVMYRSLLEYAKKYEQYADDGQLKFFCLGGHSHDFQNNNCWDILEKFAAEYGNRPDEFWYASVRDIFEYEDAVKSLKITDDSIENFSDVTLYIKIDGKETVIKPKSIIKF